MTAILGGGIAGLSAAFYASERRLAQPILLEASNRLGGWIHSLELPNGTIFEMGPRMIRPQGLQGKNTLNLIDRLDLRDKLWHVTSDHPAAKNRMIYVKEKLYVLPNSLSGLFKSMEPFGGPLIKIYWRDMMARKVASEDESMYSFVERRFGKDIADNLISPMLCGICAGDAKKISVKMLMARMFEVEQKHGSVFNGFLLEGWRKIFSKKDKTVDVDMMKKANLYDVDSESAVAAQTEKWAMWGLKGGFEQLPNKLTEKSRAQGAEIRLNERCENITFCNDHIELKFDDGTHTCSQLISSLSAKSLAPLLERQHPQLARELSAIPYVTVAIVNLEFPGNCLPMDGFGFLVPPKEKNPILGVIFDSCVHINENFTVLTVMMGGAWFQEHFGTSPTEEHLLQVALDQVAKILGIKEAPTSKNVAILKDCIAQYVVGHKKRLERIQNYISAHGLPLALCGSSYQGIGVNDVILSAKQAVCDIEERTKSR
ncbi:protoporphyrinogen oxidase [Venturia canescens]|uniref:protoporphyrinogen oxidase n=1 Tax=Venturia canescens TaxID=32260 RepID=UPI001C9CA3D1|nr:protoporphyrinogen oxidase [Venturia canescens]